MARKSSHRPNIKYDWEALKLEWLQGSETLNHFRIRHGISKAFFNKIEELHWVDDKLAIQRKAMEIAQRKIAEKKGKDWAKYSKISDDVVAVAQKMLDDTKDPDGNIQQPIEPSELRAVAEAVEVALKNDRLIHGEPTGDEGKTVNIHLQVVQVIKALKNGGIIIDAENSEPDAA